MEVGENPGLLPNGDGGLSPSGSCSGPKPVWPKKVSRHDIGTWWPDGLPLCLAKLRWILNTRHPHDEDSRGCTSPAPSAADARSAATSQNHVRNVYGDSEPISATTLTLRAHRERSSQDSSSSRSHRSRESNPYTTRSIWLLKHRESPRRIRR